MRVKFLQKQVFWRRSVLTFTSVPMMPVQAKTMQNNEYSGVSTDVIYQIVTKIVSWMG